MEEAYIDFYTKLGQMSMEIGIIHKGGSNHFATINSYLKTTGVIEKDIFTMNKMEMRKTVKQLRAIKRSLENEAKKATQSLLKELNLTVQK